MLTRSEFVEILQITSDDLKNRTRHGQVPFRDEKSGRGMYSPYEALLSLLADDLAHQGLNPVKAAGIVGRLAPRLQELGDRIHETATDLSEGVQPEEILAAVVDVPFPGDPVVHVGTLREITASMLANGSPVLRAYIVNASRAGAVLMARASRADINLKNTWSPLV